MKAGRMKKLVPFTLLAVTTVLLFTACGKSNSKYVGTWEAVKYEAYGMELTPDEIGESTMEFKSGGTVKLEFMGDAGSGKWEETDDGVKISDSDVEYELVADDDGYLELEESGVTMYFEKAE